MDKAKVTVIEGAGAAMTSTGTGHYFDQAVFDLHYLRLSMRAQRLALEAEMASAGIEVDAAGRVTLKAVGG